MEKLERIILLLELDSSTFSKVVLGKGKQYFRVIRCNAKKKPISHNVIVNICHKTKMYLKLKTGFFRLDKLQGDFGEVYKLIKEIENSY